jgi:hypothetical protein
MGKKSGGRDWRIGEQLQNSPESLTIPHGIRKVRDLELHREERKGAKAFE